MNKKYNDCGRDIGRPEEVFQIRYKTPLEAADMLRVSGERLASLIAAMTEEIDVSHQLSESEELSLLINLRTALQSWNNAHEVFVEAMAREGR